jgi:hypothetical protein
MQRGESCHRSNNIGLEMMLSRGTESMDREASASGDGEPVSIAVERHYAECPTEHLARVIRDMLLESLKGRL